MSKNSPLISIITPTFNRAETLEPAIQSVLSQGIDDLEYIIMDGGSTDGTSTIVARYPQIQFYSEPDDGLYYALNKCLKLLKGKYWVWVNSDDLLNQGVLKKMLDLLEKSPSSMALFASAEIMPSNERDKAILVPAIKDGTLIDRVTLDAFSFNAGVFRHEVIEKLNCFDTRYKIAADREFLFRFGLKMFPYQHIDDVAYIYQSIPSSLTYGKQFESRVKVNLEEMQMAKDYLFGNIDISNKSTICRRWHTRASVDACILLLLKGKFLLANQVAIQGLEIDKSWLGAFIKLLFLAIARRMFSQKVRAKFSRFRHILTEIK